jgi:hypothetical protein
MIVLKEMNKIFMEKNPQQYALWQGNCCRQTAVTCCVFLSELLPEYNWQAYEAKFDDVYNGSPVTYEHAWVFGETKEGRKLFCDLARIHTEPLFFIAEENKYPSNGDYADLIEIKRTQLNYQGMLEEREFYTRMIASELMAEIKERINFKFIKDQFDDLVDLFD